MRLTFMPLLVLCVALVFSACSEDGGDNNAMLMLLLGGGRNTAPAAPGAATVTPADGQLTLEWSAVDTATAYEVWFSDDSNPATAIQDGGDIAATTHMITGLTNGTTYYIWLKAKNAAGTSEIGTIANGTPEEPLYPPGAPGAATVTPGDEELALEWSAVDTATAYEVWYSDENDSGTAAQDGGDIAGTTHTITGLTNGTPYYIWLKAKNADGTSDFGLVATGTPTEPSPGDKEAYAADGLSFSLVYVPGGITFPTGTDDMGIATVDNPYWIGETEVTYELWYKVYLWATTDTGGGTRADGGELYTFTFGFWEPRAGNDGSPGSETESQEPVSYMNWRHAMVWCNALTEWYNANNGSAQDLDCVYNTDSGFNTPLRYADNSETVVYPNPGGQDDPYVDPDADGFRLLTGNEWELAAKYISDDGDNTLESGEYYPGNFMSGADAVYNATSGASDIDGDSDVEYSADVAVYNTSSTAEVTSKSPNALGIYDMSGNIYEWVFDYTNVGGVHLRIRRGGSYNWPDSVAQIGYTDTVGMDGAGQMLGFRFGRNW